MNLIKKLFAVTICAALLATTATVSTVPASARNFELEKQHMKRALSVNFKVLLEGAAKTSEWQTDVYTWTEPAIPAERAVVPYGQYIRDRNLGDEMYLVPLRFLEESLQGPGGRTVGNNALIIGEIIKYRGADAWGKYSVRFNGAFGRSALIFEYAGESAVSNSYAYHSYTPMAEKMIAEAYKSATFTSIMTNSLEKNKEKIAQKTTIDLDKLVLIEPTDFLKGSSGYAVRIGKLARTSSTEYGLLVPGTQGGVKLSNEGIPSTSLENRLDKIVLVISYDDPQINQQIADRGLNVLMIAEIKNYNLMLPEMNNYDRSQIKAWNYDHEKNKLVLELANITDAMEFTNILVNPLSKKEKIK